MSFEADLLPMALGGLPHTDPAAAVELVLQYTPEIPTWPQLPHRGFKENMYSQFSQSIPGIRMEDDRILVDTGESSEIESFYETIINEDLEHFSLSPEFASAFFEFERRMKGTPAKAIRGQLTGPISLALNLTDKDKRSMLYDDTYKEIIGKTVNMTGRWMEKRLASLGETTMISFDEPYLVMFGSAFLNISSEEVHSMLEEALGGMNGLSGFHCCGNTEWPLILDSHTDVLSFDAYNYYHTLSLYPDEVNGFLDRGGMIAWGVVPSTPDPFEAEDLQSLIGRLENGMELLAEKGVDKETIHRQSLVTPTCGLSGLSEEQAEAALRMTREISSHVRREHSLEE
jgi:methionine synthase II (cobalamin-independent)